VTLAFNILGQN